MNQVNLLEAEARIKLENCSASDSGLVMNMIKSELVEFCENNSAITESSNQNHNLSTTALETIPKAEQTIISGDDGNGDDTSYFINDEYDFCNNIDTEGDRNFDADSTSDPDRDPFADIDIDPSFSRMPPNYISKSDNSSKAQVTLMNVCDANSSSNMSSSVKLVSRRKITNTLKQNLQRQTLYTNLKCQLCQQTQSSDCKLKSHVEICVIARPKTRLRFCAPCNQLFSTTQNYRLHALKIHKIKETIESSRHPFKCQLCSSSFIRVESLMAHSISHHSSNTAGEDGGGENYKLKPFKCSQCTGAFANLKGFKRHLMTHNSERPVKCPFSNCDSAFKMKSNLKDHLRRIHLDDRPFQCQEPNCGKAFKMKEHFQRHLASHATDTPFKCSHSECPKAFPSAERLKAHLKIHTGSRHLRHIKIRPFKCNQCDSAFCKNWLLKEHLKIHSRDVNDFFKCPQPTCEKTFKYRSSIKAHLDNYHTTNQRIFSCSDLNCDKKFKTEKYAKKHLRIHTRPHKCSEPGCFAAFTLPSYLNSHIKSKHVKNTGNKKAIMN